MMIKKYIPSVIKILIKRCMSFFSWDQWARYSWSQEGEDQVLLRIFEKQPIGFYIDVGAHHPKRFSNTYLFYKRGWSGINIDAMPGSMSAFSKFRPRDINIEVGVGGEKNILEYFIFNEKALNGFSKDLSLDREDSGSGYWIERVVNVEVLPLACILSKHLPSRRDIDFMSIDVEGFDFDVLKSNDWSEFRPKIVLVEVLGSSLHDVSNSEIAKFMSEVGYHIYAKCVNTIFFKRIDFQ